MRWAMSPEHFPPGLLCYALLAARLESELGASRLAPGSTPTPRRSTSSPPSQPVTSAPSTPTSCKRRGRPVGAPGVSRRSHQAMANRTTMMTLPRPWAVAIPLARVPEGIAAQSMAPKIAASKPVMMPAAIIGCVARPRAVCPAKTASRSKMTAIPSSPRGKGISIGWIGCPNSLALLSIGRLRPVDVSCRCAALGRLDGAIDAVREKAAASDPSLRCQVGDLEDLLGCASEGNATIVGGDEVGMTVDDDTLLDRWIV